jgi:hypothetical protein
VVRVKPCKNHLLIATVVLEVCVVLGRLLIEEDIVGK